LHAPIKRKFGEELAMGHFAEALSQERSSIPACASPSCWRERPAHPRLTRLISYILAASAMLFVLSRLATPRASAAAPPDPMVEAKAIINQILEVLRNPTYKNSPKQMRERLRAIVEGHLDLPGMARSALGTHWRSLSAADREQFVTLFTRLMEDTYIGKAASYSGETVQFIRAFNDGPEYAQVDTKIIQAGRDPISVNYRLQLEDGDWKVYDVLVDNISLTSNYRTQFNRVINRDGYPKLVEMMKNKIQQLDSTQFAK
jgi:phospholipid transport system substrate-binding protein